MNHIIEEQNVDLFNFSLLHQSAFNMDPILIYIGIN